MSSQFLGNYFKLKSTPGRYLSHIGMIVLTWPRFPQDTIPSVLSGFSNDQISNDGSHDELTRVAHPENGKQKDDWQFVRFVILGCLLSIIRARKTRVAPEGYGIFEWEDKGYPKSYHPERM